jgi:hypothetical protein
MPVSNTEIILVLIAILFVNCCLHCALSAIVDELKTLQRRQNEMHAETMALETSRFTYHPN